MRIVYLYPSMAIYGGIERIFVDKMNLLVQLYGYDVTLVTSDQGSHAIPFELDAQVRHIDLVSISATATECCAVGGSIAV